MPTTDRRELKRRVRALQAGLKRARLDAMLVFDRANTLYLTGLRASLSYLMVTPREALLLVDGRYIEAARSQGAHCEVALFKDPPKDLARWQRRTGARKIGFEGSTPWETLERWREAMPGCEWNEAGEQIRRLRLIKSAAEIGAIGASARLNDRICELAMAAAVPGATEWDLRNAIRAEADRLGAEGLSFDTIVAGGAMGSRPHYSPQRRRLERGDLLLIDMGMVVDGYCSDMTRVVGLGKRPKKRLMRAYEAVLAAEEKALAEVAPGVACRDLDAIARETIRRRKFGRYFTHGLGHGVGLEIHEPPTLNARSREVLRAGMVVTIEPGVYLPGLGGVRIEDLVVVTKSGHKVLSRTPKAFRLLPFDGDGGR
jgi:Xaa-Pro aminopeptidase